MKHLTLATLSLLAAACGTTEEESGLLPGKADSNNSPDAPVKVSGAFASIAEQQAFEADVMPAVRGFVAFWQARGERFYHQPQLVIGAPAGATTEGVFGATFQGDAQTLRRDVAQAASLDAMLERLSAFACKYPPTLARTFRVLARQAALPFEEQRALALAAVDQVLVATPASLTPVATGAFVDIPGCSYVLLGRTAPTSGRPDKFMDTSIVLHELGHAFEFGHWQGDRAAMEQSGRMFSEAMADLYGTLFSDNPCQGRGVDASGNATCVRRMDAETISFTKGAEARLDEYERGQPVRTLSWAIRKEPDIAERFLKAIKVAMHAFSGIAPGLAEDPFYEIYHTLASELPRVQAYANQLCADSASASCANRTEVLGSPDETVLATMLRNAPSTIGAQGRTLRDGTLVRFVERNRRLVAMQVIKNGDTREYAGPSGITQVEGEPARLLFRDSQGNEMTWSATGELR